MSHRQIDTKNIIKPIIIGIITAIASSIVLLIFFSVFMLMQNMPRNSGYFLSYLIICLASVIGGFICARMSRCKGLMLGALVGFCFIFIISLIGMIAGFSVHYFGTFILKALLSVGFGAVGGILAMNIRRK